MAGTDSGEGVAKAGAENVDAELLFFAAVNAHVAAFEQDLRIGRGNLDIEKVDHLAAGGCDLHSARGGSQILNRAAQEKHVVFGCDLQGLSGKLKRELAADGVHIVCGKSEAGAHSQIEELPTPTPIPDDEAGLAGRFAIDKNLCRADGGSFGNFTEADRYARYRLGAVDQDSLAYGDRNFIR